MKKLALFFILFSLFACDKSPQNPQEILQRFVDYRFSTSQTKEGLLNFMTDKAAEEIRGLDEKDLSELFKVEHYRKRNFKILSEKCSSDKCFITYTLEYDVLTEAKTRDFTSEVKKIAELQKVGDTWKVSGVDNIKTFIEAAKPIEVVETLGPAPTPVETSSATETK